MIATHRHLRFLLTCWDFWRCIIAITTQYCTEFFCFQEASGVLQQSSLLVAQRFSTHFSFLMSVAENIMPWHALLADHAAFLSLIAALLRLLAHCLLAALARLLLFASMARSLLYATIVLCGWSARSLLPRSIAWSLALLLCQITFLAVWHSHNARLLTVARALACCPQLVAATSLACSAGTLLSLARSAGTMFSLATVSLARLCFRSLAAACAAIHFVLALLCRRKASN